MFRSVLSIGGPARLGCWCLSAALAACSGLSGCAALDKPSYDFSRAGGLGDAPPAHWSKDVRPRDTAREFWGVSNKARQIEEDCGIR